VKTPKNYYQFSKDVFAYVLSLYRFQYNCC